MLSLSFPLSDAKRLSLYAYQMNITVVNHKILLGAGDFPSAQKAKIAKDVGSFFRSTGRLGSL